MVTFLSTGHATQVHGNNQYGVLQNINEDHSGFLIKDPKRVSYIDERIAPLPQVDARAGATTAAKSKLGLLDSGINPDHPQLSHHELKLASFTDEPPEDSLGHGTSVAILMSLNTSSVIYSARVTDNKHRVRVDAFVEALAWMQKHEVTVVNVSLAFDPRMKNASAVCDAVKDFPGLIVAAAGNEGAEWKPLPANCEAENIVSATNEDPDSGVGDIAAPIPQSISYTDRQLVRAVEYITAERYQDALGLLNEFVEGNDANEYALYYSAYVHFQQQRLNEALEYSRTLLDKGVSKEHVLWLHALIVANMGNREAAISTLENLLKRYPGNDYARRLQQWVADEANALPASLSEFFQNNGD